MSTDKLTSRQPYVSSGSLFIQRSSYSLTVHANFQTSFKAFNSSGKIKVYICVLTFDGVFYRQFFTVNQMVKRVGILIKMQTEKIVHEFREKSSRRRLGYYDECIRGDHHAD